MQGDELMAEVGEGGEQARRGGEEDAGEVGAKGVGVAGAVGGGVEEGVDVGEGFERAWRAEGHEQAVVDPLLDGAGVHLEQVTHFARSQEIVAAQFHEFRHLGV